MNNFCSIIGLACANPSFRARLLEMGAEIEYELPVLLSKGEKKTLDHVKLNRDQFAEALQMVGEALGNMDDECQTPPYCCVPNRNFARRVRPTA